MLNMKVCSRCKVEKNLGKFSPDASTPDGRQYVCRGCNQIAERARRKTKRKPLIEPLVDGVKSCSTCKVVKQYIEFAPDSRRKDGRQPQCRECVAESKRIAHKRKSDQRYEEEVRTGLKLCNKCNQKKPLDRMLKKPPSLIGHSYSDYHPKCLDCWCKYQKEYNDRRKEQSREQSKKENCIPEGKAKILLRACRTRAKSLGVPFDLDLEWFLQRINSPCEKTGLKFAFHGWKGKRELMAPSVDQIEPRAGYTKANCQLVILMYNIAKNDGPADDVLLMARGLIATEEKSRLQTR